jgi:hypothetical protein
LYASVPINERPWILEDSETSRFRGTEEKGPSASAARYFVFIREDENDADSAYIAIPLALWYNFRPHSIAARPAMDGIDQEVFGMRRTWVGVACLPHFLIDGHLHAFG